MHILITSGGTSEAIDSVRSITNHSTGSLGKILAEMALAKGHQVTLITTPTALKPDPHPQLRLLLIDNVEELLSQMNPSRKSRNQNLFERRISGALLKEKSEDYLARQRMEPCHSTDRL